jgi:hypothetical protein
MIPTPSRIGVFGFDQDVPADDLFVTLQPTRGNIKSQSQALDSLLRSREPFEKWQKHQVEIRRQGLGGVWAGISPQNAENLR